MYRKPPGKSGGFAFEATRYTPFEVYIYLIDCVNLLIAASRITLNTGGHVQRLILLLPMLVFCGCAYYQPIGISSTSIGSQYERPSGMAEGVSRRWLFFPCYNACPIGEDSLKAAIDDALVGNVGDTLANVYAERRVVAFPHVMFPLIMRSDIIVTGTLVKYNTKEFPPDNDELVDFRKLDKPEEILAKLQLFRFTDQKKLLPKLSSSGYESLVQLLEDRETRKEIKEGSKESDLFEYVFHRKVYREITPFDLKPARPRSFDD